MSIGTLLISAGALILIVALLIWLFVSKGGAGVDFIRRAWLFTKAKISRTILLIITFTAILLFVLSGLIINSAANKSIDNAKKAAGATVSLAVNVQKVVQDAQNAAASSASSAPSSSAAANNGGRRFNITLPTIDQSTAQNIANLSGVSSYSFNYSAQANANSGITKVSQTSTGTSASSSGNARGGAGGGNFFAGPGGPGASASDFTINGTNNLSASTSFTSAYKLTAGRMIQASDQGTNNVVVESTLASQNNLNVGSTFSLKDDNSATYTMTVVGIYTTTSSSTENSIAFMNTMYTALSVPNAMKATTNQVSSATYSMSNPANADSFVTAASKLVNNSNFQVSKNDQAYQNVKTSLNNVAGFAWNIVLIVAIAGAIILALIVMLMVRERRFEIGVLMSLGENKAKIVGQFFAELFMVMLVSVVIAVGAGNVVGNAVGQQLLNQQITTTQTANFPGGPGGGGGGQNNGTGPVRTFGGGNGGGGRFGGIGRAFGLGQSRAETQALAKLNIQTSLSTIALLIGIAILITLVAVGLASIGILRLNPKQVLTN